MKCFTHQDTDAVAFCQSCGKGLCAECRVSITGISYCQPCLDAGRIRSPTTQFQDPEDRFPTPTGPVTPNSRLYLTLGIIGLILIATCIHIGWLAPLFGPLLIYDPTPTTLIQFIPRTVGILLVAIGISLTGLAMSEFKNYFNYRLGHIIGLYTILSPWTIVLSDLLVYTGLVYMRSVYPYGWEFGPLNPLGNGLYVLGTVLLGILFILWPVALLSRRRESQSPNAIKWASALFLIVAHMLLLSTPILTVILLQGFYSYLIFYVTFYTPIGFFNIWQAALIEPAVLLMAYVLNRLRSSLKI